MRRIAKKTRKLAAYSAGALLLAVGAAQPSIAGDTVFRVDLNKTQILRLPAKAGSIVVGNPAIADVSVQSPDTVFVVGRGYGETNLIVLDRNGDTMMDADIQVTSVTPSHGVRVFNAGQRRSFSCAPYCQPSPILGDDPGFLGENSGETVSNGNTSIREKLENPVDTLLGDTALGGGAGEGQPEVDISREF